MPTYEYVCSKCGHEFEVFHSITAPPVERCPIPGCNGSVKRRIGAGAGLIFRGSGFYITDYKMKASSGFSGSNKSESGSGENKSSTNSTSKSNSTEA